MMLIHYLIARLGGYFWLRCDSCGRKCGGHQRGFKPRYSTPNDRTLLCPRCARKSLNSQEGPK